MFDTMWSAIATLAATAGILAALAFIVGMILFWKNIPDNGSPGELIGDNLAKIGRHAK